MVCIIQQVQTDEIYNLAAQSMSPWALRSPSTPRTPTLLGAPRIFEAICILGLERKARYAKLPTCPHAEVDLLNRAATEALLMRQKPDFIAAAMVGAIAAYNTMRVDSIYRNLTVKANLIHGAWLAGVRR